MKVMVTGGTGFVGACIVAGLLEDGHEVRLLVRRPGQAATSLAPYGVDPARLESLVTGDVLDADAVATAIDGCDAVVHAAAVFALDSRRTQEVLRTNERAAELVLGQACAARLDPVVHISSTVVLTRFGGSGPDLPLGDIPSPYSRSKVASEVIARRLQGEGMPVVCIYPGAVLGPHDPYRGVQSEMLRWQARGTFPLYPRGGLHVVDVRTVAAVVRAAMEPGRGPRRYVVPGSHVGAKSHYSTLARVQGRHRPCLAPPTPARTELGVQPVPFEQSLRDTLQWLVDSGRLPHRYAPRVSAPVVQG